MKIFILVFLSTHLTFFLANAQIATTLRQIIMVFRHGERAPLTTYPTDPYGESYWVRYGGLGEITSKGLFQTYSFGQFLKNYYNPFLTPSYSPDRVYSRSIDIDRSLMSANTFLSGMYPPSSVDQLWSPSVSWYPIPVHTNDQELDPIFYNPCNKYDNLINESLNSMDHRGVELQNRGLVQSITQSTGLDSLSYANLYQIYDNAMAKQANGLPLENWLSQNLDSLRQASEYRMNLNYGTVEKAKYVSGSLLYNVINIMRRKTKSSLDEITVFSCQDSHIRSLMTLLNLATTVNQIPFASAIIFELRQDASGLYYIQLLMRSNSTTQQFNMQPVKMANCDQLCPLGNFLSLTADRVVQDLAGECDTGMVNPNATTSLPTLPTVPTSPNLTQPPGLICFNSTNGTGIDYHHRNNAGLTNLELILIIVCSVLAAVVLFLLIIMGLIIYRNKVRKVSF